MTFGERVRKIREKKGLTQKALGEKLGIKQQTVAQYERAKTTPKVETVDRLAEALEVPRYVLTGDRADVFVGDNTGAKITQYFIENMSDEVKNMDMGEADLILNYRKLNSTGKDKVRDFAEDLAKIPEYRQ